MTNPSQLFPASVLLLANARDLFFGNALDLGGILRGREIGRDTFGECDELVSGFAGHVEGADLDLIGTH
jgi:hypothetical protein